jgi:putative transposase
MPRRARLRIPGLPLHVIQRGVNRAACFRDDSDRALYMELLAGAAIAQGCDIHSYVLMGNHVHMLLTPSEAGSASRMMKQLGELYVPQFNERHGRTGTLWEGRFKSAAVDSDSYFLRCHRYIELNPVRAGMALHPRDYRWSSYLANAEGMISPFLTAHPTYNAMAHDDDERRAAYRRFIAGGITVSELHQIRGSINSGVPLGEQGFVADLERKTGRRLFPNKGGRPAGTGRELHEKPGSDPGFVT